MEENLLASFFVTVYIILAHHFSLIGFCSSCIFPFAPRPDVRVRPRSVECVVEVELDRKGQNIREKVPYIFVWVANEVGLLVLNSQVETYF